MSDKIKVICPSCHAKINAPVAFLGKKAKCPRCTNIFEITAPRDAESIVEFKEIEQKPQINIEQIPPAHLLFLTKFLYPIEASSVSEDTDNWLKPLNESPQSVVNRFLQKELIAPLDLASQLDARFNVVALKHMLKDRNLAISGRKNDLIERLIQADKEGMKKAVSGFTLYQCTVKGRTIAEEFIDIEKKKRLSVEQKVYDALKNKMFKDASILVASFETGQIFKRGLNIDWRNYNTSNDVVILNYIFNRKPKILTQISNDCLEYLRIAAGMMYLWGVNYADNWLPAGMKWELRMNESAAARMLLFHAYFLLDMDNFRSRDTQDIIAGVSISIVGDSDTCSNCRSIQKRFIKLVNLRDVPELPYERCTNSEDGCRCSIIGIDKFTYEREYLNK